MITSRLAPSKEFVVVESVGIEAMRQMANNLEKVMVVKTGKGGLKNG